MLRQQVCAQNAAALSLGKICSCFIGLSTGHLVKDEYFTLYEAVGALEVRICHCGQPQTDKPHNY